MPAAPLHVGGAASGPSRGLLLTRFAARFAALLRCLPAPVLAMLVAAPAAAPCATPVVGARPCAAPVWGAVPARSVTAHKAGQTGAMQRGWLAQHRRPAVATASTAASAAVLDTEDAHTALQARPCRGFLPLLPLSISPHCTGSCKCSAGQTADAGLPHAVCDLEQRLTASPAHHRPATLPPANHTHPACLAHSAASPPPACAGVRGVYRRHWRAGAHHQPVERGRARGGGVRALDGLTLLL